jgi:hypothetical protein
MHGCYLQVHRNTAEKEVEKEIEKEKAKKITDSLKKPTSK